MPINIMAKREHLLSSKKLQELLDKPDRTISEIIIEAARIGASNALKVVAQDLHPMVSHEYDTTWSINHADNRLIRFVTLEELTTL